MQTYKVIVLLVYWEEEDDVIGEPFAFVCVFWCCEHIFMNSVATTAFNNASWIATLTEANMSLYMC